LIKERVFFIEVFDILVNPMKLPHKKSKVKKKERMEWTKLLSQKRYGFEGSAETTTNSRSNFESDIDRIVFSAAFRRLSRKTQVHPLAPNDHIHNRMSHSLEVARVGSALGIAIGHLIKDELPTQISPSDIGAIVHAACLAHDIGNPPFGHAGEEAIKGWFDDEALNILTDASLESKFKTDLCRFEGNAQGFRIITKTEKNLFKGGLHLSCATLATFLKYPWDSSTNPNKFSSYLSEAETLKEVATEVGLIPKSASSWCRHPLSFLVEAADDICYGILDLEDAVELCIIQFDEVFNVLTICFEEEEKLRIKAKFACPSAYRVNLSILRSEVFDKLVTAAIDVFKANYDLIIHGQTTDNLFDLLPTGDRCKLVVENAKELAKRKIFNDTKKVEIELGSSAVFSCLLEEFCGAAIKCARHLTDRRHTVIDWKSKLLLRLLGDHSPLIAAPPGSDTWNDYQCIRRIIDFISGMTDNYAIYVANQIRGAGFTGVQRP
jgi:dGTPase